MTMSSDRTEHAILLVEDNMGDADLVRDYLQDAGEGSDQDIAHVTTIAAAVDKLEQFAPDIVLLDLRLPDGVGVATVEAICAAAPGVPIVVLTGVEDEQLALECIEAGAQDYLCKSDINAATLRKAIGFSVVRTRQTETQNLRTFNDKVLNAAVQPPAGPTDGSAAEALKPLRERSPDDFDHLIADYAEMLQHYVDRLLTGKGQARPEMQGLVRTLTRVGAGPRDLVELHTRAVEQLARKRTADDRAAQAMEGRYMALELMVLLAEQYRETARKAG